MPLARLFDALDALLAAASPAELPAIASALAARLAVATGRQVAENASAGQAGDTGAAPRQLLDVRQAATLLRVSVTTVYNKSREGELPSVRVGRRRLFDPAALEAWQRRDGEHG